MPTGPTTPAGVLAAAVAANPARPFLTFYDDETGERTELSLTTFENWVAKTANLLRDGLALEAGARVAILLPLHWQAAVWHAACWVTGAVAVPLRPGAPLPAGRLAPDVVVVESSALAGLRAGVGGPLEGWASWPAEVVALALRPLAQPGAEVPPPATDYDVEVRAYGDRFTPSGVQPADAPALAVGAQVHSAAELVEAARSACARWHLGPQDRVLVVEALDSLSGVVAGLLAPLAAGASVVMCRRPAAGALPERIVRERVTAMVGPALATSAPASASPFPVPRLL